MPLANRRENVFVELESLKSLNLSNNQITSLSENTFDGLFAFPQKGRSGNLKLSNNPIGELPEHIFRNLPSLKFLWLDNTDLSALPEDLFSGLTLLYILELRGNNLIALPDNLFEGLFVQVLGANDNPGTPLKLLAKLEWLGSDKVAVRVASGTPAFMTVTLAVEGGTLSTNSVVIPAGGTTSEIVTVTPVSAGEVTVSIESVGLDSGTYNSPLHYTGVEAKAGPQLVFNSEFAPESSSPVGEATEAVAAAATSADDGTIWSATMTVGIGNGNSGFSTYIDLGELTPKGFTLNSTEYHVKILGESDGQFYFALNPDVQNGFRLHVGEAQFASEDASIRTNVFRGSVIAYIYQWDPGTLSLSDGDTVEVGLTSANTPATGAPTISSTSQVGETLTAYTSGIEDVDGLGNVSFSYQWIAAAEIEQVRQAAATPRLPPTMARPSKCRSPSPTTGTSRSL